MSPAKNSRSSGAAAPRFAAGRCRSEPDAALHLGAPELHAGRVHHHTALSRPGGLLALARRPVCG
eukprot:scaffold15012_cov107-Isochrysis_galbana.AAC.1